VLCSILASSFSEFNQRIKSGEKPVDVAREALNKHWRIIFNGNGYGEDWPKEAAKRGLWNLPSCVDAIGRLGAPENIALFESLRDPTGKPVMSKKEVEGRVIVMVEQYTAVVEMEALCMIDLLRQHVIPSALATEKCGIALPPAASVEKLNGCVSTLQAKLDSIATAPVPAVNGVGSGNPDVLAAEARAKVARELRLEVMDDVRQLCDAVEAVVPASLWTLATYKELLFLDAAHGTKSLA